MKNWLLCLPALCLAACLNEAGRGAGSEAERPGGIQFVPVDELDKASTPAGGNGASFTLDSTSSSFSRSFTLQNTGDMDVTGIDLVTDNPNVVFSPAHIVSLPAHSKLEWNPVVQLKITHGKRLDAEGWGGLLPKGDLVIKAVASGKTSGPADETIFLSETMTFNTYVKLADIELLDGGAPVDLFHPAGNLIGPSAPVSGWIPYYLTSDDARILNSGNTPIKIRFWSGPVTLDSLVVEAGDTAHVGRSTLEIDAGGVVSDVFKLRRVPDGRIFLVLRGPVTSPAEAAEAGDSIVPASR